MKQIQIFSVFLCFISSITIGTAQNQNSECEFTAETIANLGSSISIINEEQYEKFAGLLKDCTKYDPVILYAKALLILNTRHLNVTPYIHRDVAYEYLKDAAGFGYKKAELRLAMEYIANPPSYAYPHQSNGDRAKVLFEKHPGDPVAEYGLGYIKMKGLATRPNGSPGVDYYNAVRHFRRSKLPMAKYWEGVMTFFGYAGSKPNKTIGLDLIKKSGASIAPEVYDFLKDHNHIYNQPPKLYYDRVRAFNDQIRNETPVNLEFLNEQITGDVIELDASGVKELRRIKMNLKFLSDKKILSDGSIKITAIYYQKNGSEVKIPGYLKDNTITLENYNPLPITFRGDDEWHHNVKTNSYGIAQLQIASLPKSSPNELTRYVMKSTITLDAGGYQREKTTPLYFTFVPVIGIKPNLGFSSSTKQASTNFAKVHPNPFTHNFSVSFNLETTSKVKIEIFNLLGIKVGGEQLAVTRKSGMNTVEMDSSRLLKGNHILRFSVDDKVFTQTITKL